MEKRDLYDINGNLTGKTIYKGEQIPDGYYIIVMLIFIQNSEGKFLIQKRSELKNGKYATTGGHAKSGETSLQGIITEVEEEIGLKLNSEDLKLYYSGREDSSRVFFYDYYIKKDILNIEELRLQKEEVDSLYWFTAKEIIQLNKEGKFFVNHYEEFERLIEWLNIGEK